MFVKALGPVVFSDSSDDGTEDDESNQQNSKAELSPVKGFQNDSVFRSNNINNEDIHQPNKKKKIV